ncbi:MAG TPA: hypothetical protein VI790_05865, partial [Candidatus Nanoarchaeia archaeon]|nr:hypothetical protein [Candidatus Nanoarchaeia archaeon]
PTDGVGILEFRAVVTKMVSGAYNYILMSVRNNAEGSKATNIKVNLENLEPFRIYECNNEFNPGELRVYNCNQFFDDVNEPYRTHKVNSMFPDEEIQFFWNIRSPNDTIIAGMPYAHTIYYNLEYDYKTTITQTIAGISQQEYLERSKEGPVSLSGQTISSPGELKLESKTQQPIIYLEGSTSPLEFTLEFDLNNKGTGVIKPGSTVIVAVKRDDLTSINDVSAANLGWVNYDGVNSLSISFNSLFPETEFEELNANARSKLYLKSISSDELTSGKQSIMLPVRFNTQNVYEPQRILTFSAYISYSYLKEGSTSISVYPTE